MFLALAVAPPSSSAVSRSDWLGRINEIRTASQLPPVVEERAWSAGILAHLNYLWNTPSDLTEGVSLHSENPASPYYTPEGAKEGESSDLGDGKTNVEAIDNWLAAPFHAIGMLRPGLEKVAFARVPSTGNAGLDVISGINYEIPPKLVLFPGPDSTIDLAHYIGESPPPIETCLAEHPGADYDSAGLPLIALLTESPAPDLSATLTLPDGTQVSSDGTDRCVVTASTCVTRATTYGPTGSSILSFDNAVFLVPRLPLVSGRYSVTISQPGKPDIAWSFNSEPKPEFSYPQLLLNVHGSKLRIKADKRLVGHVAAVAIQRNWVPCGLILHDPRCTWVRRGPILHRRLRLAKVSRMRFRRPGRWERVAIHVRVKGFEAEELHYPPTSASIVIIGPKPHHVAR
jgi:hypothetical protein